MTRRLVSGALVGALAAVFAGSAARRRPIRRAMCRVPRQCNPQNSGYVLSATGTPDNNVVRSGVYNGAAGLAGNLCWRTGYWTPAMAIDAVRSRSRSEARRRRRPPPRRAATAAAPAPAAAATAAGRAEDHAGVEGAVRFRQGGAEARRQGRDRQRDHRASCATCRSWSSCSSPATPTRSATQRTTRSCRSVVPTRCATTWSVEGCRRRTRSRPSAWARRSRFRASICNQKNLKELIACLAPNRRVEVEVKGEVDHDANAARTLEKAPPSRGAFFSPWIVDVHTCDPIARSR